ncbi:RNA-binding transcriptional accessory protein [Alkaliphilus pronyensis]|uniref:RNA-binding transcriptional accessory protein n=1 Tax=Alkaliphilus pronyensis TaxID=1482732 RepID=A0A6I0EZK2_9FIRM|nr:Tex family protein [Alkaliphilus pronyensis]KAB3532453.1 RNA-binding transcriptional accessory protein [Alkaliphilus pronyensis]
MNIVQQLVAEFQLKEFQVVNTMKLIDEGNTIPFIARYRKEQTGELSDIVLRDLSDRLNYLRNLEGRKEEVIRLIDQQEKLTPELEEKVNKASTIQEVEDIYRPFRPKRRTRATIAKEKGLEPLANLIYGQTLTTDEIQVRAADYINDEKEVQTLEDALNGAMDIIAETVSDNADYRKQIRSITYKEGVIISKATDAEVASVYDMYYDFREAVKTIADHRVLAINRGEKEEYLKVKLDINEEAIISYLKRKIISNKAVSNSYIENAIQDAYKRLISPSIEREIRVILTEKAEEKAIRVFGENLKKLLLQPPVKDKVVMGFDPAYRTGCKIAIVDGTGKLLDTTTIYPTAPQNDVIGSKNKLKELIENYNVDIIAIGNGTASRESELIIAEMIKELKKPVYYMIVSEAGASVYSASEVAAKEYPNINVSLRGAISIARRLQDPLAELVKIEPKHVGVGQYQHDVNQKRLDEALTGVVEDCVNSVGVDLNTASPSLLQYVSGITKTVAENIVRFREEEGIFTNRQQLKKVKRLGPSAFVQCAGFLRITDGDTPLDNTSVHPESYAAAEALLNIVSFPLKKLDNKTLNELKEKLNSINVETMAEALKIGLPTLKDIIKELKKPGRDPREEMPKPLFRTDVLKLEDLKVDMVLNGTVRNVIDFGAFIDIGIKNDGLVHISELSDRFIKNPMDVVSIGDIVNVKVIGIDFKKGRVSLSMKGIQQNN